jgi:AcrR family transcriptional regulator
MDDLDWFYSRSPERESPALPPHAPPSDGRRQAIIESSYRLLVEKGFAGFRVRDAAGRAGITAATLYYYFKTKESLVQAVDNYLTQLIVERQLAGSSSAVSMSPREQLHAHLDGIRRLLQTDPSIFIALHELYVRSLRDPAVQEILERGDQGWHGYLASMLQEGVREGQFRQDLDPGSAAWVVLSFIKGLSVTMPDPDMAAAIHELETWLQGEPALK